MSASAATDLSFLKLVSDLKLGGTTAQVLPVHRGVAGDQTDGGVAGRYAKPARRYEYAQSRPVDQ